MKENIFGATIQYQRIQSQNFVNFYCCLLTIQCKYQQLLYILLSKKTNISKMTSDLLGSNLQFESNQTRGDGTKCVDTKQLRHSEKQKYLQQLEKAYTQISFAFNFFLQKLEDIFRQRRDILLDLRNIHNVHCSWYSTHIVLKYNPQVALRRFGLEYLAQLFSTNAFSANTFSLDVLSTFTSIYSQSIVNTNNFFTYFYQRKQISRKLDRIYQHQNQQFESNCRWDKMCWY